MEPIEWKARARAAPAPSVPRHRASGPFRGALRFPSIRRIIADEMRGWIEKGRKKDRKGAKEEEEDGRENGGLLRTDGQAQNASTQSDSDCNFFTIDFDSGWPIHLGILHSKMLTLPPTSFASSRNAASNRALACGSPLARDWRKTITADATAEEKRRRGDGGKQPPPSSV